MSAADKPVRAAPSCQFVLRTPSTRLEYTGTHEKAVLRLFSALPGQTERTRVLAQLTAAHDEMNAEAAQ